jgi:hypothetical protein
MNVSYALNKKSSFLSLVSFFLFLILPPCYMLFVGTEGYPCTWSHSRTHTYILGRNSLDEWSARRGDLCLTTHNTHNRQTSIPLVGLKPKIAANERVQTHTLDRATTGIGQGKFCRVEYVCYIRHHIRRFADRIICPSPASLRHTEVITVAISRAPVE